MLLLYPNIDEQLVLASEPAWFQVVERNRRSHDQAEVAAAFDRVWLVRNSREALSIA
jgi:hypothetical protein